MPARHPLPLLWLLSDARNDHALEGALAALPRGSGFVFRHYHLDRRARGERFRALSAVAQACGVLVVLAGETMTRENVDGIYGSPKQIAAAQGLLKLATAHDGRELDAAARAGADAVFLSPVFPTRSHHEAPVLGSDGFHALARTSPIPVIALGGMTKARAAELAWPRWGAIDGLVSPHFP